ncbi:hypothetical protein E2320_000238 [Naja naja]|nr:hypothetical protein E2320_000238 [Naja naja]
MELERFNLQDAPGSWQEEEPEEEKSSRCPWIECSRVHNTVSKWMLPGEARATYLERASCIPPPVFILAISLGEVLWQVPSVILCWVSWEHQENFREMIPLFGIARLLFIGLIVGTDVGFALYRRFLSPSTGIQVSFVAHIAGGLAGMSVGYVIFSNFNKNFVKDPRFWICISAFLIFVILAVLFNVFFSPANQPACLLSLLLSFPHPVKWIPATSASTPDSCLSLPKGGGGGEPHSTSGLLRAAPQSCPFTSRPLPKPAARQPPPTPIDGKGCRDAGPAGPSAQGSFRARRELGQGDRGFAPRGPFSERLSGPRVSGRDFLLQQRKAPPSSSFSRPKHRGEAGGGRGGARGGGAKWCPWRRADAAARSRGGRRRTRPPVSCAGGPRVAAAAAAARGVGGAHGQLQGRRLQAGAVPALPGEVRRNGYPDQSAGGAVRGTREAQLRPGLPEAPPGSRGAREPRGGSPPPGGGRDEGEVRSPPGRKPEAESQAGPVRTAAGREAGRISLVQASIKDLEGRLGAGGGDSSKQPRILLMGLRRSGKSSIQKVVFHKMSPNETLFLESTTKIHKDDVSSSSFVNFQIWDFPGQMDFFDPAFDYELIFRGTGALIYVIDAQDDYMEALTRLHITVSKAYKINPEMNFEVFIHKAFSKVVQKLIPQLPTLENLLNIFISNSGIEKAFLFDVVSKIYIATDSSPVDMQSYELCCDMIDVVIDVSCIYGLKEDGSGSAYDEESMAIIKLNNTTVLYLKEVTKFLALVCILREESFERKGLIDYNFHCFRKAIHEVFEVGLSSHRSCGHQANIPNLKAVTHNGTPKED